MKTYSEYKSVTAEVKIVYPSHWQCLKPKFFVSLDKGRKPNDTSFDNTGLPPYLTMDVLRGRDTLVQYPFSSENLLEVHDNDTLILWDGANAGEVMASKHGFLSSTMALVNFDTTKFNKFFMLYLLKSKEPVFKLKASGTTIPHFDGKYFLDTPIAFPNYDEQTVIAEYLDEVTGKIDALVAEKQALVDELRAYRTSLITETVTRGLNPNAPLKNSGIDWLGDIPQHWQTSKLKYYIDINSGVAINREEIVPDGKYPVYGGGERIGDTNNYNIDSGTIIIGRVGARCGCVKLVDEPAWATDNALICTTSLNPKYLSTLLEAANLNRLNESNAQPLITSTKVKNLVVSLPPIPEQKAIADFLDAKTAKIDETIAELEAQLKDLADYKQAVITEAVTGKVDVREWKPKN